MKYNCPHCNQNTEADDSHIGLEVECPLCSKTFIFGGLDRTKDLNVYQAPSSKLKMLINVRGVLDSLEKGDLIQSITGRLIQVASILIALVFAIFWAQAFKTLNDVNFSAGIALLIWQAFFPIAIFFCVKTAFIRSKDIMNLGNSEFMLSNCLGVIITLHGEIALIFLWVMSIPLFLLTWFSASFILPIDIGDGFFIAILVFFTSLISGYAIYLLSRWIREWSMAIFSIATNVSYIAKEKNNVEQDGAPNP